MIQKIILIGCMIVFGSCGKVGKPFKSIAKLPSELDENSGMVWLDKKIWMINDSGNSGHIYCLDKKGTIEERIKVKNAKNIDWEDLATNNENHIYIGDFGNNENHRDDLAIYSIDIRDIKKSKVKAQKMSFELGDQDDLYPKKKNKNFDIEAFVYADNGFYLFTKNRSSKFKGVTKVYRLELGKTNQVAQLVTTIDLCNNPETCQVTGAAIHKDDIVLLMHDKVYLLPNFRANNFTKFEQIKLGHKSQKEAICFKNKSVLFVSDEKGTKKTAKLYQLRINK